MILAGLWHVDSSEKEREEEEDGVCVNELLVPCPVGSREGDRTTE